MNDLQRFFESNTGRVIHKWPHYFEIYDRHFSRYRGTDVHIMEFGVSHGGSLAMWKDYFGPRAKIFGCDINENCLQLQDEQVEIFIGDQDDRRFLQSLIARVPRIDILIDDGGHTMQQQINTFEIFFPGLAANGVYLCEDVHTSYWPDFGGGYKRPDSFIEYSKNFVDHLNAWHSLDRRRLDISAFTRSVHSLHYYDSIVAIEKRPVGPPVHRETGTLTISGYQHNESPSRRMKRRIRSVLDRVTGRG